MTKFFTTEQERICPPHLLPSQNRHNLQDIAQPHNTEAAMYDIAEETIIGTVVIAQQPAISDDIVEEGYDSDEITIASENSLEAEPEDDSYSETSYTAEETIVGVAAVIAQQPTISDNTVEEGYDNDEITVASENPLEAEPEDDSYSETSYCCC